MGTEKGWKLKTCMDCNHQMRRFRKHKDKILCFSCYRKRVRVIGTRGGTRSLSQALSKTYTINGYLSGRGVLLAFRSFPTILIGHKVKLELVK